MKRNIEYIKDDWVSLGRFFLSESVEQIIQTSDPVDVYLQHVQISLRQKIPQFESRFARGAEVILNSLND